MEIELIAKKLEEIINSAVVEAVCNHGGDWKERYEWLTSEIRQIRDEAQELRNHMDINMLTANSIESEGFLRCAIAVCSVIDRIDSSYEK